MTYWHSEYWVNYSRWCMKSDFWLFCRDFQRPCVFHQIFWNKSPCIYRAFFAKISPYALHWIQSIHFIQSIKRLLIEKQAKYQKHVFTTIIWKINILVRKILKMQNIVELNANQQLNQLLQWNVFSAERRKDQSPNV